MRKYKRPRAFDRAVWNSLDVGRTRQQIVVELYAQGIDTSYTQVWRSCERLLHYGHVYNYGDHWLRMKDKPPVMS
jgi:hypothetical protein